MKRICTICARAGSKGVQNKNLRVIAGKPLIAHSLLQARASGLFDAIACSSDSAEILAIAEEWGAQVLVKRPDEMAGDLAPKVPVIRHCVEVAERILRQEFQTCVDLDATSPLRLPEDIVGAVTLLEEHQISNVITGTPARRSPYFNVVECDPRGVARLSKVLPHTIARRQDAPACYDMNASIYVWQREALMRHATLFLPDTRLYIMPEERSHDIDSALDLEIVSYLMERGAR